MLTLKESVEAARISWELQHGKCSMCNVGDEPDPVTGLHRGKHLCGNTAGCDICHGADMPMGEQCAACGRIKTAYGP